MPAKPRKKASKKEAILSQEEPRFSDVNVLYDVEAFEARVGDLREQCVCAALCICV
jgi:hypothetical protein